MDLINILPGFPVVNSPLELRFYVRLKAGVNQHVTIDREVLYAIFENFAQNISEVLGVEFTGTQILDPDYIFRHSWLLYQNHLSTFFLPDLANLEVSGYGADLPRYVMYGEFLFTQHILCRILYIHTVMFMIISHI